MPLQHSCGVRNASLHWSRTSRLSDDAACLLNSKQLVMYAVEKYSRFNFEKLAQHSRRERKRNGVTERFGLCLATLPIVTLVQVINWRLCRITELRGESSNASS